MGRLDHAAERGQDLLIEHRVAHGAALFVPRRLSSSVQFNEQIKGIPMLRTRVCLAAMLLVAASLHPALAQTAAPAPAAATPAPAAAKPSKIKLTVEKLKDMKAKWSANRPKLAACRKEVKSKGLAGDDRWFYIEDCMGKT
jgi:hypothetical protein